MLQNTDKYNKQYFMLKAREVMRELSKDHINAMGDVTILIADEPNAEQREASKLQNHHVLLGLYEGIPLPYRTGNELAMSDTITLFRKPLLLVSKNEQNLNEQIKRTLWHEIAHLFGLEHSDIDRLEEK